MNYDLRYDGPDVEAELSSRQQGALMGTSMIVDALTSARQSRITADGARAAQLEAATLHADRAVWADTPAGVELSGLPDEGIARRWAACAAHPDQPDASEVRTRLEAELARRDPETMRDYRSWRNAAGAPPGEAMRRALAEREARLADRWTPLTNPQEVAGMDADEVLGRWADAHAAHGTDTTRADLEQARTAGAHRLAAVAPERLAAWNALQTAQPTPVPGVGARPGLSPADAAARTAGRPSAFLPGPGGAHAGWEAVAQHGVQVAGTAARMTAGSTNPIGIGVQVAARGARHAQYLINRGMHP